MDESVRDNNFDTSKEKVFFNSQVPGYLKIINSKFLSIETDRLLKIMKHYRNYGRNFSEQEIEDMRSEAYESGYQAGLDECRN